MSVVPLVLLVALLVPMAEIATAIKVGQLIGGWPTLLLIAAMSALGLLVVRHEGRRAWRAMRAATEQGRVPAREAADGALVLLGGLLLLLPGLLSDVVGLLLLLPPTRALVRHLVTLWAARRVGLVGVPLGLRAAPGDLGQPAGRNGRHDPRAPGWQGPRARDGGARPAAPDVVAGEVVGVEDDPPRPR